MEDADRADLVVVGSGFHGLSMARTYLQLNPAATLVILDAGTSIGGVWATDRLYPSLRTNNQFGTFEFSDFPMDAFGGVPGQHIAADVVRRYLEAYAAKFDLARRVRLGCMVDAAEDRGEDGWLLTMSSPSTRGGVKTQSHRLLASKLVVASGLTSEASMPSFANQASFAAPVFHSRDFGSYSRTLGSARSVAVLSGNKSACDVVHAYAAAGVSVHWIIRESGHGPCWMGPPRITPFKILAEKLMTTRAITWLNPCLWGDADGFGGVRWLLHGTPMGRRCVDWFARRVMQAALEKNSRYDDHPDTAKLRPWYDVFWTATGRGLLNYDSDLLEFVRQGAVKVYVADVEELSERAVHLTDGTRLEADALVCCTGWQHGPTIKFTRDGQDIAAELGLPHSRPSKLDDDKRWLIARADAEILTELPRLRDQPPPARPPHLRHLSANPPPPSTTETMADAYALYRFMVPPSRIHARTLAFSGAVRSGSTAVLAQIQALWITAFFAHRLPHLEIPPDAVPDPGFDGATNDYADGKTQSFDARVAYESILHNRFGRWRYPHGFGALLPDLFFDALPLFDLMLGELELKRWRKGGWVREVFESYEPSDYEGLVEEWVQQQEGGMGENGAGGRGNHVYRYKFGSWDAVMTVLFLCCVGVLYFAW